jgi:hypothetical protein
MAFLDNSGDIILDAVLTDAGRQRLARGDGSFKITQFALGDDEINYALYNTTASTALSDISILQTPVLEAFTNNIASLNSKLLTIPRNNLLHLPVIKMNSALYNGTEAQLSNTVVVLVDDSTEKLITDSTATTATGLIFGYRILNSDVIELHQGLDTTFFAPTVSIPSDLKETQYTVEIDNRLGILINPNSNNVSDAKEADKSYVDDDNVALYYFSSGTNSEYVKDLPASTSRSSTVIAGPTGTSLSFLIKSTLDAQASNYLFDLYGQDLTSGDNNFKIIKSTVTVSGVTTGYSVSIPVSFMKKV